MTRVYVGNLDARVIEKDLEDEFLLHGIIRSIWIARSPPGYAFIVLDDEKDALNAIHALNGKNGWRVELAYNPNAREVGGRGHGRGSEVGDCSLSRRLRGQERGRQRGPSPYKSRRSAHYERGRRSNSHSQKRSPRRRSRSRSRSPPYRRGGLPRRPIRTPTRSRSRSRSPPYRRGGLPRRPIRTPTRSRRRSRSPPYRRGELPRRPIKTPTRSRSRSRSPPHHHPDNANG